VPVDLHALAQVVQNRARGEPPRRRNAFSCNSAQIREFDWNVRSRTYLRLQPSGYSQHQLGAIAASLNARPRKSLGLKAPAELFLPKEAFDFKKHWSTSAENYLVALGA
jgi:hypothetical protein